MVGMVVSSLSQVQRPRSKIVETCRYREAIVYDLRTGKTWLSLVVIILSYGIVSRMITVAIEGDVAFLLCIFSAISGKRLSSS